MRLRSCGSAREVVAAVAVEVVEAAAEAAAEAAVEEPAAGEPAVGEQAVEEEAGEPPAAAEPAEKVGFHHFHLGPNQDHPNHARQNYVRISIHVPTSNAWIQTASSYETPNTRLTASRASS